jgi:hypothetical protein
MTDLNLLKSSLGSSDLRSTYSVRSIIISMTTSLSTREVVSGEAEDTNYPSNSNTDNNHNNLNHIQ